MLKAAIVYFCDEAKKKKFSGIAQNLAKGMESQGAVVDIVDASVDRDKKLTGYHYLAIGCDVRSIIKGKLPPQLVTYLSQCGMIGGKRSFAFVEKSFIGSEKTLKRLMSAMEHEALMLRYSEIVFDAKQALAIGSALKLN